MDSDDCIDDETLARALAHTLDDRERAAMVAHLELCDDCRRLVAGAMQLADETRTLAGRYRLEGELGRGGMGMVYRARDDVLERVVAIKLLPPGVGADDRARARLVRESKAMARLRHRNVVAVFDAGYDGDQFYVAMEHVDGTTLRRWLAERRRTQAEILAIFVAAARGLAAAHAVGVIHRDFKPDNVLIDELGEPRVADFGLARTDDIVELDEREREDASLVDGLTATGQELGTPAYMAPEQYGGQIDRRVDVFAFCVALHEALYGVRPFVESSIEARLAAIARGERVPVAVRMPARLRRLFDRGLATEPSRRFADMEELVVALEAIAGTGARRRRIALALGGAAALAAGVTAMLASRPAPCAAPDDRLHAAWSPGAIAEVERHMFEQRDHIDAQMTWSRLRPTIAGVVAAFDQESRALCEAERNGDLDDELAWRRAACLRVERTALAYRLELAATGDLSAAEGFALWEPAEWCRDLALTHVDRPPPPELRALHDEVELGLAESSALMQLGRMDAALARAVETVTAAEQLGDPVLLARAHFEQGRQEPDPRLATAQLQQAAQEAAAVGEHVTAARAWIYAGYYADHDGRRCLDEGRRELARIDNDAVRSRVAVRAEVLEAELLIDEGDPAAARACFERAAAAARDHVPALVPDILFTSTYAAWADGDVYGALAQQRELVRWHADAYTPNRQTYARAMWNLAGLELIAGELDEALRSIQRAHELGGHDDDTDEAARRSVAEAEIRLARGELDRADEIVARVEALPVTQRIPDLLVKITAIRGVMALARGDAALAARVLGEVGERLEPRIDFGIDAVDARALRAEALRRTGDAKGALAEAEAARAELLATHPRLQEVGRLALVSGWALVDLGRPIDAAPHFEQALARLIEPAEIAWAELGRIAIARARGATPDRAMLAQVKAALERWPDAHRFERDALARLAAP